MTTIDDAIVDIARITNNMNEPIREIESTLDAMNDATTEAEVVTIIDDVISGIRGSFNLKKADEAYLKFLDVTPDFDNDPMIINAFNAVGGAINYILAESRNIFAKMASRKIRPKDAAASLAEDLSDEITILGMEQGGCCV